MIPNIKETLLKIDASITKASSYFLSGAHRDPHVYNEDHEAAEYYIESAFLQLLVLLDVLQHENTYGNIKEMYNTAKAKGTNNGLLKSQMGIDEPYLLYGHQISMYLYSIANIYNIDLDHDKISSNLVNTIRQSVYSITDKDIHSNSPKNENDLQLRIESILKCIYPDMLHKPNLTKQIKNYIPDTGIPSLKTLIEYKYITNPLDVKRVCDEMLADTRGYISNDWEFFLFVVYETQRVKAEHEYKQLFRDCKMPDYVDIIVLSGEPKMNPAKKVVSAKKKVAKPKTAAKPQEK